MGLFGHGGFLSKIAHGTEKVVSSTVGSVLGGGAVGQVLGSLVGLTVVGGVVGAIVGGSSHSSSNSGTTVQVQNDTNVYIPELDIHFEGALFKPNTRLYVFFDNKDITSYVTPDGGNQGDALISDAGGRISGMFHIPNTSSMRFVQGKKEIKFTDSNKNDDSSATTFASAYFTYTGNNDNTATLDLGGETTAEHNSDPLVQSFYVLDAGGIYLNSLNLYFLAKDPKYPILFQIREVVNDQVSNSYLSNSNIVISADSVNTDGPTTITMPTPVYLQEGKEYAIYLVTNAPATYSLATCVYGQTDAYNQLSTKDPRIGSMMKYLGNDSWLRDNTKGLKFNLYKCAFDTQAVYNLALDNASLSTKSLPNNSIFTTYNTNKITVRDVRHSFNVGDYVTISGLTSDTTYGGISSNYINGIHRVEAITWNTYSFSNYIDNGSEEEIPDTATQSVAFGNNVVTDYVIQYDTLILNNTQILLANTTLDYTFKGLSGQSLDGMETPNVFDSGFTEISNKVEYNVANVKKINSSYNEENLNPGSAKSLQLNIAFKTNNENITPVVDVLNTNAILIENIINNQSEDELSTDNGKGIARYITKDIGLSEQSNGIRVIFDANIQGSANVRVYYKVLPVQSTGTLSEQQWVEMTLDKDVKKANNNTTYSSYVYTTYGIPLFKAFKTKVLMTSPDSTKPPLIENYKAIAFQSISYGESNS